MAAKGRSRQNARKAKTKPVKWGEGTDIHHAFKETTVFMKAFPVNLIGFQVLKTMGFCALLNSNRPISKYLQLIGVIPSVIIAFSRDNYSHLLAMPTCQMHKYDPSYLSKKKKKRKEKIYASHSQIFRIGKRNDLRIAKQLQASVRVKSSPSQCSDHQPFSLRGPLRQKSREKLGCTQTLSANVIKLNDGSEGKQFLLKKSNFLR